MDFRYRETFGTTSNTGYERLLYDCMVGDATLFQRADMVETGWSIVEPIQDAWKAFPPEHLPQLRGRNLGTPGSGGTDPARRPSLEKHRRVKRARISHRVAGCIMRSRLFAAACGSYRDGLRLHTVLAAPWLVLFSSARACSLDRSARYALRSRARAEGKIPAP